MPDAGIVIVTYNSGREIGACLDAALACGAEIVVVDNASTDGTRAEVARRGVRLLANGENRGFVAAVNQGIRAFTAPLILLLNPDAVLIQGLDALCECCREAGVAGAGGLLVGGDGRPQIGFSVRALPLIWSVSGISPGPVTPAGLAAAAASGLFRKEIVPVVLPKKKGEDVVVEADEHPRPDTTLEGLARLKPIVRPDGTVTAGNASGVNDGSCALLIASEEAAKRNGLTPRARIVAMAVAGVTPRVMGIGPIPATRKVLALAGLELSRMDVIELNEAFSAQSLAVLRELGLPDDAPHVNPNGGAIALGHPLGMSGARLVTTATYQLQRTKGRYALCTMCIGVGQGIAMILERV